MTHDAHEILPDDLGPWAVVANILRGPRGGPERDKTYYGTKVFAPGAKVFVGDLDGGALSNVGVVGLNRVSKRLSASMVGIRVIENLRSKVIYDGKVLQKLLWSQFMQNAQEERAGERNVAAGHFCLFRTEAECDAVRQVIQNQLDR